MKANVTVETLARKLPALRELILSVVIAEDGYLEVAVTGTALQLAQFAAVFARRPDVTAGYNFRYQSGCRFYFEPTLTAEIGAEWLATRIGGK